MNYRILFWKTVRDLQTRLTQTNQSIKNNQSNPSDVGFYYYYRYHIFECPDNDSINKC